MGLFNLTILAACIRIHLMMPFYLLNYNYKTHSTRLIKFYNTSILRVCKYQSDRQSHQLAKYHKYQEDHGLVTELIIPRSSLQGKPRKKRTIMIIYTSLILSHEF